MINSSSPGPPCVYLLYLPFPACSPLMNFPFLTSLFLFLLPFLSILLFLSYFPSPAPVSLKQATSLLQPHQASPRRLLLSRSLRVSQVMPGMLGMMTMSCWPWLHRTSTLRWSWRRPIRWTNICNRLWKKNLTGWMFVCHKSSVEGSSCITLFHWIFSVNSGSCSTK